jgi:two-component system CheB/CheR fusion protein
MAQRTTLDLSILQSTMNEQLSDDELSPNSAETDRQAQPVGTEEPPHLPFPVVGIGASAGGLEAFIDFFKAMRPDSGLAFVLVQHLPPERESLLVDILARHTTMSVREVRDGMAVEPNCVYAIRPGHTLTISKGILHLGERLQRPMHTRPVDDFFKSLAEEQRERAICIIMSGMGSNGTAGAQAVKAVGGLCIAQDPELAQYPSMPRHLIDAGYADYVLSADSMPSTLLAYAEHPYARGDGESPQELASREQHQLREILAILRTRSKKDFGGYKKPTVLRRIQRRMGLCRIATLSDYAKHLRQNPTEVTGLSDDLLIHVTGFFRDPRPGRSYGSA